MRTNRTNLRAAVELGAARSELGGAPLEPAGFFLGPVSQDLYRQTRGVSSGLSGIKRRIAQLNKRPPPVPQVGGSNPTSGP